MNEVNVKEMLDGVDEEQLSMIVSALQETAARYDKQGMIMVALKMRLTAEKVLDIKKAREEVQTVQILGRFMEKEKTTCSEQVVQHGHFRSSWRIEEMTTDQTEDKPRYYSL